jgi:hypothetical protein
MRDTSLEIPLSLEMSLCLPHQQPQRIPPDPCLTPTGPALHKLLSTIIDWKAPPTQKPEFSFWWSTLAAKTNWEILQQYDMDLGRAITAQPFSTLTIGSEF